MTLEAILARKKFSSRDRPISELEHFYTERRSASEIPCVTLKSVIDRLAGSRWARDAEWELGEKPNSQEVVESDEVIDVKMRKEYPANLQEVSGFKPEERSAIEKDELLLILGLEQEGRIVKGAAGRLKLKGSYHVG